MKKIYNKFLVIKKCTTKVYLVPRLVNINDPCKLLLEFAYNVNSTIVKPRISSLRSL